MKIALTIGLLGAVAVAAPVPRDALNPKADVERTWKAAMPVFEGPDGATNPKAEIGDKGTVTLQNRGMLVTKDKRGKGTVSFSWKWTEGNDEYPDSLVVALRCEGKQNGKWSHEVPDGLLVRFSPGGGTLSINDTAKDETRQLAPVKMAFEQGVEYKIAIIDEGTRIRVVVGSKEALTADVKQGEGYTALYNREPVAGVGHKSLIQYLRLEGPAALR